MQELETIKKQIRDIYVALVRLSLQYDINQNKLKSINAESYQHLRDLEANIKELLELIQSED